MKINLGSGVSNIEGYTNVDIFPLKNVDIVHDLEKIPYPFESNSADEIYTSHFLEHCSFSSIPNILAECQRILKPEGILYIIVPCLECSMKTFLEANEEDRDKWGWKLEYIFGNQGRAQVGQQYHKTGFTQKRLEKLVRSSGFEIISNVEIHNSKNNCIHLKALKI